MRMVGVLVTCEGSQGDGGAVAKGDGEHCSKVRWPSWQRTELRSQAMTCPKVSPLAGTNSPIILIPRSAEPERVAPGGAGATEPQPHAISFRRMAR